VITLSQELKQETYNSSYVFETCDNSSKKEVVENEVDPKYWLGHRYDLDDEVYAKFESF
jgi:hypothetical protein